MAIKLGAQDISKAFLGSTELSQIFLGTVPLLDTALPILPPVTAGLINFIDVGVLACWDNLSDTLNDLVPGAGGGPNNWVRNDPTRMLFEGTPGVRGIGTRIRLNQNNQNARFIAQVPYPTNLEFFHNDDSGPWTIMMLVSVNATPGVSPGRELIGGERSFSRGWNLWTYNSGCYMERQTGGSTVSQTFALGNTNSWSDEIHVVTISSGPTADFANCLVKHNYSIVGATRDMSAGTGSTAKVPWIWSDNSNASERTQSGSRFYSYALYDRALTDQEIADNEAFLLATVGL